MSKDRRFSRCRQLMKASRDSSRVNSSKACDVSMIFRIIIFWPETSHAFDEFTRLESREAFINRYKNVFNTKEIPKAVSDLLLGVFCMPFTLVGQLLRNFIFGEVMCRLIPYFQAVSVSVGVWTLVAISLERYFAICRPLKSRRWQTQFHAYKMIAVVWLASLAWSSPVLLASRLQAMREPGRNKCREVWPSLASERIYNLFLDAMLLLVPLVIMSLAYGFIVSKLWKGLRREIQHNSSCRRQTERSPTNNSVSNNNSTPISTPRLAGRPLEKQQVGGTRLWLMVRLPVAGSESSLCKSPTRTTMNGAEASRLLGACSKEQPESRCNIGHELTVPSATEATYTFNRQAIRSNYMDKSIDAKKKVIRMLFVVVAEFFVCWAPLHVLNTWYVFNPDAVYAHVGRTGVALVQLLAYISSCCNPITYCFMNRKFRAAFLGIFGCRSNGDNGCCPSSPRRSHTCTLQRPALATNNNSDVSGNDSTQCAGRASVAARSEVLVLEAEDRV